MLRDQRLAPFEGVGASDARVGNYLRPESEACGLLKRPPQTLERRAGAFPHSMDVCVRGGLLTGRTPPYVGRFRVCFAGVDCGILR